MDKRFRKIGLFISFTFFFSWLMAVLFFAFGGKWGSPSSYIVAIFYMFIPMIAAITVQKLIYKEPIKEALGISFKLNRWFFVAWLLPLVVALVTVVVSIGLPGVEFSTEVASSRALEHFRLVLPMERVKEMESQTAILGLHPFWFALVGGLIAGITVNAVAGFGEELGWRGFLQKEFSYMSFWKSSITIGVIWGIWHGPIILQGHNYPQHPIIGVLMMTVLCILLAPIFSYVRLKARSVIAAAIIHGSLNGTAGLPLIIIKGGNDLTVGITGLAGFIVLACINVGIFILERERAKEGIVVR